MPDLAEGLFPAGGRVTLFHAHPDDETLASGALIAWLASRGDQVDVLTATRGEQGEIVPGSTAAGLSSGELVLHRVAELGNALDILGAAGPAFLGTPPARVAGLPRRHYTDSGMRWLDAAELVAGPGESAGPDSLTAADLEAATADLCAHLLARESQVLISYDRHGGYGHPDHVACHELARAAARDLGIVLVEIVSEPLIGQTSAVELELPEYLPQVLQALACYSSQLSLDGMSVVHVGGQRQPITTTFHLAAIASESE